MSKHKRKRPAGTERALEQNVKQWNGNSCSKNKGGAQANAKGSSPTFFGARGGSIGTFEFVGFRRWMLFAHDGRYLGWVCLPPSSEWRAARGAVTRAYYIQRAVVVGGAL